MPETFLIRGSTIFPWFSTRKLGSIHLPSHFSCISSSTQPNHAKLGIHRKPLSRRIQRRRLRDVGTSFHRGRRRLSEWLPSDQNLGHYYLLNRVPFLLTISPHSTNILPQFHNDSDNMGYVLGVEMWVLLVGFAGYGGFWVRMGL